MYKSWLHRVSRLTWDFCLKQSKGLDILWQKTLDEALEVCLWPQSSSALQLTHIFKREWSQLMQLNFLSKCILYMCEKGVERYFLGWICLKIRFYSSLLKTDLYGCFLVKYTSTRAWRFYLMTYLSVNKLIFALDFLQSLVMHLWSDCKFKNWKKKRIIVVLSLLCLLCQTCIPEV